MNYKKFEKGDRVRYVPSILDGDYNDIACNDGVVSSVTDSFVFVKYDFSGYVMVTGEEPYTAQATLRETLVHMEWVRTVNKLKGINNV